MKTALAAVASAIPQIVDMLFSDFPPVNAPSTTVLGAGRRSFKRRIHELLFDDEEWEQRLMQWQLADSTRTRAYVLETVANYSEATFREHFKMSRTTVEKIICLYQKHHKQSQRGRPSLNAETVTLVGLWRLVNVESFRQISARFNVTISTAHDIFMDLCSALFASRSDYIIWPKDSSFATIASKFETRVGLPGVIGAIDGCHISIKRPKTAGDSYLNKNEVYSVNAMCTVDADMRILDVFAGWCGSAPNSQVFRSSPLYRLLTENPLPPEYYLIGNSSFPLCDFLMVPYWDNGDLACNEMHFNLALSSTRTVVDRAFALLKGKFRRLGYLDISNCNTYPEIIIAACVLHNMCIDNDDFTEEEFDSDVRTVEADICVDEDGSEASAKRDAIAARTASLVVAQ